MPDLSKCIIEPKEFEYEHRYYGECSDCGRDLTDCNVSCNGLCRDCYDKVAIKVKPFPHDDFDFPIARGVEQRRRVWLIGVDTKTVEGFVDIVSTIDVDMSFKYAFASENGREQFKHYEWNGVEIFDPKRNVIHTFTCWDKHIFTHWDNLVVWICSLLNRCEYGFSISRKSWEVVIDA